MIKLIQNTGILESGFEDDVLVTIDGNHVLSEAAIKNVDDIEYLMSQS